MDGGAKKERAKQRKGDLIHAFKEQLQSLVIFNNIYDRGHHAIAKDIAVKLRVLLFTGEGRSRSQALIKTLRLDHVPLADYSSPYNSKNIMAHHGLVSLQIAHNDTAYYPLLHVLPKPRRYDDYDNWWSKRIVVKDSAGITFTRKKLVLELADTDGGAHVDEGLDPSYHRLSRENSMGWTLVKGDGSRTPLNNPVPPSIRQISHEVVETFSAIDLRNASRLP